MKKQQGFTLIELMVTVAIISVISAVAVPSYQRYIIKTHRTADGMPILINMMRAQEDYFATEYTYTTNMTHLNFGNDTSEYIIESHKYGIKASTCDSSTPLTACVLLTATGKESQTSDGYLTLDSKGNRTHNGTTGW